MISAELIAKVEAARSGSPELNADVYEALGYRVVRGEGVNPTRRRTIRWRYLDGGHWCAMRDVTGSFEAALWLLPKGLPIIDLELTFDTLKERGHPAVTVRWYPPNRKSDKDWRACIVSAPTPALALCAAALKARAA